MEKEILDFFKWFDRNIETEEGGFVRIIGSQTIRYDTIYDVYSAYLDSMK